MISILMPTFDRNLYIKEAVLGIVSQEYQDWELLIKDSGHGVSFDTVKNIIQTDKRVKYIYSQDNGITEAMNYLMSIAQGDVFMWANDDDVLLPHALKTIHNSLKEASNDVTWGYGKISMRREGKEIRQMGQQADFEALQHANLIPQPAVFWKKEAYLWLGPMNEKFDLVSDYEYWLRLMKNYNHVFIDDVLAYYRLHDGQITHKDQPEQLYQARKVRELYA